MRRVHYKVDGEHTICGMAHNACIVTSDIWDVTCGDCKDAITEWLDAGRNIIDIPKDYYVVS